MFPYSLQLNLYHYKIWWEGGGGGGGEGAQLYNFFII